MLYMCVVYVSFLYTHKYVYMFHQVVGHIWYIHVCCLCVLYFGLYIYVLTICSIDTYGVFVFYTYMFPLYMCSLLVCVRYIYVVHEYMFYMCTLYKYVILKYKYAPCIQVVYTQVFYIYIL